MALSALWVDRLFDRLVLRYGTAFLRQYGDIEPAAVKADWADVLDGTSAESIGYALRYLPADRPPNAMQFRDQCRRAPTELPLALPAAPADPQRVQAAVERMQAAKDRIIGRRSLAQECIANIEAAVERAAGRISPGQRHMVAHCLRMPGTSTSLPIAAQAAATEAESAP